MLFTSLEFLLVFLPITLLVYYVLPRCARNVWLLATSLVFYAWGEPFFVMVMIFSIIVNYVVWRDIVIEGTNGHCGNMG